MPTVAEVLKSSGMTDEQIAALDAKVISGFTEVVSTAQKTLEQAELIKRAQADMLEKEINPALNAWANEKASYDTKIAAYEAALKGAKEGGFQVPEILTPAAATSTPTRAADGKFVSGANVVPGSPEFVANFRKEAGAAIGSMLDLTWKYQSLYGTPMPDSPTKLIEEATAQRMDPISYAAKKYDFAGKEKAIKEAEQKKHDDAIRAEQKATSDKEWAEKVGSNPNIRQAEVSKFSTLDKAVKAGERPDPLKMTREQRHVATGQIIRKEIAERETVQ